MREIPCKSIGYINGRGRETAQALPQRHAGLRRIKARKHRDGIALRQRHAAKAMRQPKGRAAEFAGHPDLVAVLRPGAMLLATTPNHARLRVAGEALAGGPLERRLDPRADHLRFFTAHTLRELLSGAGFEQVSVVAFDGPPLLRRSLIARAR